MGMDVYGKQPTAKGGEYFRNNVWWWRPLAEYACEVAPRETAGCTYWQSNDGEGLDAAGSAALADALQAEIDSGRCAAHALKRKSAIEMMADEPCWLCEGTGTRGAAPALGAGDPAHGGIRCNGCDGRGFVRPDAASYPFSVENVQKFVAFLRASGGFEIC